MQLGPNVIEIEDDITKALFKSFERIRQNPDDPQILAFIRGLLHEKNGNWPRAELYYRRVEELAVIVREDLNRLYPQHEDIETYAIERAETLELELQFEAEEREASSDRIIPKRVLNKLPRFSAKNSIGYLIEKNPDNDDAIATMISSLHKANGNLRRASASKAEYNSYVSSFAPSYQSSLGGALREALGYGVFSIKKEIHKKNNPIFPIEVPKARAYKAYL